MEQRKAEFIMTIIGASLAILGILFMGIMLALLGIGTSINKDALTSDDVIGLTVGGGIVFYFFLLAVAACIIGFIAAFKMKNGQNVKGWSITLIVVGGLCFFSYGWITGVLFLISGIMSVVKSSREKRNIFYD